MTLGEENEGNESCLVPRSCVAKNKKCHINQIRILKNKEKKNADFYI